MGFVRASGAGPGFVTRFGRDIFRPLLCERLLFRGGTALHKIVLPPAARYSEDLDFVQIREEPIGETLDRLKARLDPWLGVPKSEVGARGATVVYRFESELPPRHSAAFEDRNQYPRASLSAPSQTN